MLDFYNRTTPKARKEYKCEMCGKVIPTGEVYSCETGKFDGDIFTRRLHMDCYKALALVLGDSGENEFDYDWISDWWKEHYCTVCIHRFNDCKPDECECDPKTCG